MKEFPHHFFQNISAETDVRIYVKDKTEIFLVTELGKKITPHPIMVDFADIGESAISFLYFNKNDYILDWLQHSKPLVQELKLDIDNPLKWHSFITIAEVSLGHPYYFILYSTINNAYKRKLRDADGNPLPDDFLAKIGLEYSSLRTYLQTMVDDYFDATVKNGPAIIERLLSKPSRTAIQYPNVYIDVVPANDYKENEKTKYTLSEVLRPNVPEDIANFFFVQYLKEDIQYKRCQNCLRYFVTKGKSNVKYCDRIVGDTGKTCKQVAPKATFLAKAEEKPAERLFNKVSKTMYSRVSAGKYSKQLYKEWSKEARQKRDACSAGALSVEDYATWLAEALGRNPLTDE